MVKAFILKNKKIFTVLVLSTMTSTGLLLSFFQTINSLERFLNDFLSSSEYDVLVSSSLQDRQILNTLDQIDSIRNVTGTLQVDVPIVLENGERALARCMGDQHQELNEDNEVLVQGIFARYNSLQPGDTVSFIFPDKSRELNVSKIETKPEFINQQRSFSSLLEESKFGMFYVNQELLEDAYQAQGLVNTFYIKGQDITTKSEREQLRKRVEAAFPKGSIHQSITRDESPEQRKVESDLNTLVATARVLPVLIYLLSFFIGTLFFRQFIQQKQKDIAILRSIGYSKKKVIAIFLTYAFVVSLIANVLGIGLCNGMCIYQLYIYQGNLLLPHIPIVIDWSIIVLSIVLGLLVNGMGVLFNMQSILKVSIGDNLRTKHAKESILLSKLKIPFLSVQSKLSILVMCRHPGRFLLSILYIVSTIAIMTSALAFNLSKDKMLEEFFDFRVQYDAKLIFNEEIDDGIIQQMAKDRDIREITKGYEGSFSLEVNGENENIKVEALKEDQKMIHLYDMNQQSLAIPTKGLILPDYFARKYKVEAGDVVQLNGKDVTVSAISDQNMHFVAYISISQFLEITNNHTYNPFVLYQSDPHTDIEALSNRLYDISFYHFQQNVKQQRLEADNMFTYINTCMYSVLATCMLLGVLVLVNMSIFYFKERRKDYRTMRLIGIRKRRLFIGSLPELILQCALSSIIGIPFGMYAAQLALQGLRDNLFDYPLCISNGLILMVILITLIYAIVGRCIGARNVKESFDL